MVRLRSIMNWQRELIMAARSPVDQDRAGHIPLVFS